MLQNAYLPAKIGDDTAENEQHFAENLAKIFHAVYAAARQKPCCLRSWLTILIGFVDHPFELKLKIAEAQPKMQGPRLLSTTTKKDVK